MRPKPLAAPGRAMSAVPRKRKQNPRLGYASIVLGPGMLRETLASQRHSAASEIQETLRILATSPIVHIVPIAHAQTLLRAVAPDRALNKPREVRGKTPV